jgi:high-affinity nickel-transport protein
MDLAALGALAETGGGLGLTVAATVFLAGFRHGFDLDHVAAITDIASATPERKRSFLLATTYAVGHMLVVFALGVAAVFAGDSIPASWDAAAGRLIGLSLVLLGLYVAYSIARYRRDFRMRSRWMLLVAGARRGLVWMRPTRHVIVEHEHEHPADGHHHHDHEATELLSQAARPLQVATRTATHKHTHRHIAPMPSDPFSEYSPATSFVIGMIHGIGAETPTQILLFTTAAGLAGALGGVSLVTLFVVGLLLGNTVLALVSVAGVSAGRKVPVVHLAVAAVTAVMSIAVGSTYLFGPV